MTAMMTPRSLLRGLLVSLALAAAFFSITPASGAGAGLWSQTGSMKEIRTQHTLTLLKDGKVLVTGGWDYGWQSFTSAELYDPAAGTWSFTASMNETRVAHTATRLQDGRVLVTGGKDNSKFNPQASAELYDPLTETWSRTGSMAGSRYYHTATLLQDGGVLVIGGSDGSGNWLASTELYNPADGKWYPAGSISRVPHNYTATLLRDGTVLVAGGGYAQGSEVASAELYQPSPDLSKPGTWSPTGSMAERRGGHTATLLPDGQVLVAGGVNTVKKGRNWKLNYLGSGELYDPDTKT